MKKFCLTLCGFSCASFTFNAVSPVKNIAKSYCHIPGILPECVLVIDNSKFAINPARNSAKDIKSNDVYYHRFVVCSGSDLVNMIVHHHRRNEPLE